MSFVLFIVLNGILLIRPEELWPEIAGLRLYLFVIAINLLSAWSSIIDQFRPGQLKDRPITVCVLGLLAASALSLLAHGRLDEAEEFVPEFAKVVAYYLLLVAVVTTPTRLRMFLGWQIVFITIVATLGVLQFHEYIDIEAIKPIIDRRTDLETGEVIDVLRLRSSGIFNDPNDLCLILVFGSVCAFYLAATARSWAMSGRWLLPIPLYVYTL